MVCVNRDSAARVLGTVAAMLHLFLTTFCRVSDLFKEVNKMRDAINILAGPLMQLAVASKSRHYVK